MIEQWILEQIDRLTGSSPVIISRDPQRMIVSGAQAVDGWAEVALLELEEDEP
jgi:hypothetical protein